MNLTFGSVCSGIEAASVAFDPLGWKAAWFSEIESYPSALLKYRYMNVPNLGDMTTLPALIRARTAAAPDLLCGGTPCQAFSVAGNRDSLEDARGNLTLVFCEVANAIDDVRAERGEPPCVIKWENVPGVLSTKDNAFGCFLAELAGESVPLKPPGGGRNWPNAGVVIGPRRTIAWRLLDAQYFGLAQRRARVFVVASARAGFDPAKILFEFDGVRRDSAPRRETQQGAAANAGCGFETAGTLDARAGAGAGGFPGTDGATSGHVVPCWWDGGGLSQTLDAVLHKGQTMPEKNRFPAVLQPMVVHGTQDPCVSDIGFALGRNTGQENAVAIPLDLRNALRDPDKQDEQNRQGVGVGVDGEPSSTLSTNHVPGVAFAFKPSHFTRGKDGAPSAVMPPLTADADKGDQDPLVFVQNQRDEVRLMGGDGQIVGALPVESGSKQQCYVAHTMQVRRLMPVECERLQGFPDDYTRVPFNGKTAKDGPRYKAIGNSWPVPVVVWIAQRIDKMLEGLP